MARAAVFRRPVTVVSFRSSLWLGPLLANAWYAHYSTITGELLSLGTVYPDSLPDDTAIATLLFQPNLVFVIWDPLTLTFVERDVPVIADRVDDLVVDSSLSSVWAALDSVQQDALKDRIGQMLGPYRHRYPFQPIDLDLGYTGVDW